jgi:hypothetical protein
MKQEAKLAQASSSPRIYPWGAMTAPKNRSAQVRAVYVVSQRLGPGAPQTAEPDFLFRCYSDPNSAIGKLGEQRRAMAKLHPRELLKAAANMDGHGNHARAAPRVHAQQHAHDVHKAKTNRGQHSQSIEPSRPTKAAALQSIRSAIAFARRAPLLLAPVGSKIESKDALVIGRSLQHLAMPQCASGIVVTGAPMFLHSGA